MRTDTGMMHADSIDVIRIIAQLREAYGLMRQRAWIHAQAETSAMQPVPMYTGQIWLPVNFKSHTPLHQLLLGGRLKSLWMLLPDL